MKPGDLIFVHGTGPISNAIERFDGPFSHVAMAMPFDTVTESQYLVNTRDIANPYKESEITVLDLGLTDEERQALVNAHFKYLSYKYDLKQIAGIFFHDVLGWPKKPWINKNELICSRYMVRLLQDAGFFKKHAWFNDVSELTPNSLFNVLNVILNPSAR